VKPGAAGPETIEILSVVYGEGQTWTRDEGPDRQGEPARFGPPDGVLALNASRGSAEPLQRPRTVVRVATPAGRWTGIVPIRPRWILCPALGHLPCLPEFGSSTAITLRGRVQFSADGRGAAVLNDASLNEVCRVCGSVGTCQDSPKYSYCRNCTSVSAAELSSPSSLAIGRSAGEGGLSGDDNALPE
jgi:hypothetical protein